MKIRAGLKSISFAEIMLFLGLVLAGLFYEYLACAALAVMLVWLIIRCIKEKKLKFTLNFTSVSVLSIGLFFGLSTFYAVDSGMAFIGFIKFLPVVAFMLILMQDKSVKDVIINRLPYVASALTIISAGLMYIPALSGYFSVSGRMAGFFQYPNTFALFLLVAELTVLAKEKLKIYDIISVLVLMAGIILTGSRTVFVLTVLANIALVFVVKGKKAKIITACVSCAGIFAVLVMFPFLKNSEIFGRFFTISIFESTFVGRLLYFKDSLPLILKHPFGMGYTGYYYLQQSVQTGVYTVKFVHNDFLQLMLDVGWIPAVLFVVAVVKSVISKNTEKYKKLILITMSLHFLFDFDLQYVVMYFVLLLFMDFEGKEYTLKKSTGFLSVVMGILLCLTLYTGVVTGLFSFKQYNAVCKIYPWHTENNIELLFQKEDAESASDFGEEILRNNKSVYIAYSAKARYAYSQGDFGQVIACKGEIFKLSPFNYEEYEEYCYMLINGIELYTQYGDDESADICKEELIKAYDTVTNLEDKLSMLGKKIVDQPATDLPEDIDSFVATLR